MRNPKELALSAVIQSLNDADIDVTEAMSELIEDLVNDQWNSRNRDLLPGKDEAALMKLVKDFIARTSTEGSGN